MREDEHQGLDRAPWLECSGVWWSWGLFLSGSSSTVENLTLFWGYRQAAWPTSASRVTGVSPQGRAMTSRETRTYIPEPEGNSTVKHLHSTCQQVAGHYYRQRRPLGPSSIPCSTPRYASLFLYKELPFSLRDLSLSRSHSCMVSSTGQGLQHMLSKYLWKGK